MPFSQRALHDSEGAAHTESTASVCVPDQSGDRKQVAISRGRYTRAAGRNERAQLSRCARRNRPARPYFARPAVFVAPRGVYTTVNIYTTTFSVMRARWRPLAVASGRKWCHPSSAAKANTAVITSAGEPHTGDPPRAQAGPGPGHAPKKHKKKRGMHAGRRY